MNYLAHFHLSHGDDGLLLGALLGDYVKGPLKGEHRKDIEQGIVLHRKIDAFTDQHTCLQQCQRLFAPQYRRYASIMTDVAFDHFLNRHWSRFHSQPLEAFSDEVYRLCLNSGALTGAAKRQAENLARYQVLESFQHWQTVQATLQRIQQRLRRANPLANAAEEMQRSYDELEQIFLAFYPELQRHAKGVRAEFYQGE